MLLVTSWVLPHIARTTPHRRASVFSLLSGSPWPALRKLCSSPPEATARGTRLLIQHLASSGAYVSGQSRESGCPRAVQRCQVMQARVLTGVRAKFSEADCTSVGEETEGDWRMNSCLTRGFRACLRHRSSARCLEVWCSLCWVLGVLLLGVGPAGICFPSSPASLRTPCGYTP